VGTTYSEVSDLLVGTDLPLPPSPEKFVQDAADEIDSVLGMRYQTPIAPSDPTGVNRPTVLLIKRISNWLASGRIIMAQASGSELQQVHAYGKNLVDQATVVLQKIENGEIVLPGVATLDPEDLGRSGPIINNLDDGSNVESFYGMVSSPPFVPYTYPPIFPFGAQSPQGPYTW
jgi:hypothetical protein